MRRYSIYILLLCFMIYFIKMIIGADMQLIKRFFSMQDRAVYLAVIGCVFLGINSAALGSFMVVRKMALVGDALSHAVLPGVVLGFLLAGGKNPIYIFIGALLASGLSSFCINALKGLGIIKEDSILGMVMSGFYGLGICLLTMLQQQDIGGKAGLHTFLLGQACALSQADIYLILISSVLILSMLFIFYKEWLLTSFDSTFANSIGLRSWFFHYLFMSILAFCVVCALQASGAILVTALLIIPASTAYMLTDRMHHMLYLAMFFGGLSGFMGVFLSFLSPKLPTGPLIVMSSGSLFILSFLLSPSKGVLFKYIKQKLESRRILEENTLKHMYKYQEKYNFLKPSISLSELSEQMRISIKEVQKGVKALINQNLVQKDSNTQDLIFTSSGKAKAIQVVRSHRLWELYLIHYAHYAKDHVHEDAETIEHLLSPTIIESLEEHLAYPTLDPHGQPIPSLKK